MAIQKKPLIVAVTFVVTVLAVVLGLNLSIGDKKIERRFPKLYSVSDQQFLRTMGVLLGPPLVAGNRATVLQNGDEIFPAMLEAIHSAKKTITFETYIYWSGKIGKEFAEALAERAKAGVKVHVLLDAVGSGKIDSAYLDQMKRAGVEVRTYHPVRWYTLARLNNRTHRKLLVTDGKTGFTGGVGIADEWSGHAQDAQHWRDTHFRIEGPAVAQMQGAFMDNWMVVTGDVLHGGDYFPAIEPVGSHSAQVFTSSPDGGAESMQLMYLLSLTAAQRSIQLSMSYFIPDELAVRTLVAARQRGVLVQMILPGTHMDSDLVRKASRAQWGPLLKAGVEIYEYQPTMFHCKVMIVDELWTSVGSTNFDSRSFSLNDEANLNIYDHGFAQTQVQIFEQDLKRSRRITWEEWNGRPWTEQLWENTLGSLSSQL
jgi:cardiolipin synthase